MGMLVIVKDWGVFRLTKINGMEFNTDKILEETLVQSAFQQTLGDELLSKKTVNVPEWTSCSFDFNLLENLCQVLKMVV